MRFKQFLLEETMSVNRALEIFGLESKDAADKGLLKRTFSRLAKANHPDHGGDVEQMKLINLAYEVLKKAKVKFGSVDWESIDKKYRYLGSAIKTALIAGFKPEVFTRYFEKIKGEAFNSEILQTWPGQNERSPHIAGFKAEFFTDDRNTIFELDVIANLIDIAKNNSLGFEDLNFSLSIIAYGFYKNKKQKLSKSDWKFTNDHSFFSKPEKIFPKHKLEKIFSGATSQRAFKKRDMYTFLTKKLKAKTNGDYVYIPLKDDYWFVIYRTVFMRQPFWHPNGIYFKRIRRVEGCPVVSLPETEETAKFFETIQKKSQRGRDQESISNIVNTLLKSKKK